MISHIPQAVVSNLIIRSRVFRDMAPTQKQNVVVVGGGISGVTVAQGLSKKLDHRNYDLILIEPRPYHVWLPATARMVVTSDEKFAGTVVFPFDKVFTKGKGTVRLDKVLSIVDGKGDQAGELELASGETLQYRGGHIACLSPFCLSHRGLPCQLLSSRPVPSGPDPSTYPIVEQTFASSRHNGARGSGPHQISSLLAGVLSELNSPERSETNILCVMPWAAERVTR